MSSLQEMGIGIIYFPGLESLIESHSDLIHTIEIEPQTLWFRDSSECDSFSLANGQVEAVRSFDRPVIFHGVGFPVGGSHLPSDAHFATMREHIDELRPAWISEHLSFNKFDDAGETKQINFLLPPLQTDEGVRTAVRAITNYKAKTGLPFAFETGVNYLRPKAFEMDDGAFVAQIAEEADCHILLDVHNILANEKNGRQSVPEFVSQLPLERVCEIHVAGGFEYNGFYLDSHSGVSSDELFTVLEWVVRQTPNLKAIIFEMIPEYATQFSERQIRRQFEEMNRVWDVRGRSGMQRRVPSATPALESPSVSEWATTLGRLALSKTVDDGALVQELSADKGLAIITDLLFHFRASMIVGALTLTTRLLRLTWGSDAFNEHLKKFMRKSDPHIFESLAAEQYARHLVDEDHRISYLYKVLEFETAAAKTRADNVSRRIEFDFDPFPVLEKLADHQMPETQRSASRFLLEITPDKIVPLN